MDVDMTEEQRDLQNHGARYLVGETGTRHPRRADARPTGAKALGGPRNSGR